MSSMIDCLIRVRWLTWVTVRPARRRASARASSMLTPRLHCSVALRAAPATGTADDDYIIAPSAPCPPARQEPCAVVTPAHRHAGPDPAAYPPTRWNYLAPIEEYFSGELRHEVARVE